MIAGGGGLGGPRPMGARHLAIKKEQSMQSVDDGAIKIESIDDGINSLKR